MARVFTSLFAAQTLLAAMPAHAQLTAAPMAPSGQKPLIDAAANGTPIVLIAPPSKAGVSRNQYDQFNVAPKGLILNNSTGNVQTHIGGWITGNLQLGQTPARIILNEVTGANASQLKGTIEVGGQKADIVIANPNGITCDGCGFLNANRATITTGTAQFGAEGAITGFDVRQGLIQVGPNGLNATEQQQLDFYARGIVIDGEVYSQNLQAVIGANQVVYGTLGALPQSAAQDGTGEAPSFAIDIKALGGMYAGQIYLIATEKGLGVNSVGRSATLAGNLVLSANGDLTLKDTFSSGNAQLTSTGKTTLTGQTLANGSVTIDAPQQLSNSGALQANTLQLNTPSINNSGSIAQTEPGQNLALVAARWFAKQRPDLHARRPERPGRCGRQRRWWRRPAHRRWIAASRGHQRPACRAATGGERQHHRASADLECHRRQHQRRRQREPGRRRQAGRHRHDRVRQRANAPAGSDIALERARIGAIGNVLIAGSGAVTATRQRSQQCDAERPRQPRRCRSRRCRGQHQGRWRGQLDGSRSRRSTAGRAGPGISTAGATLAADKISIDAGAGALNNQGGKVLASSAAADALTVKATGIGNQSGELHANGGLTLDARGGLLDNTTGVARGQHRRPVPPGGLTNKGGILYTHSDLNIAGSALDNSQGAIVTAGSLTVATPGQAIDNTAGLVQAGGSVSLDSGSADLKNAGGAVAAGAGLTVKAGTVETTAGTLAAADMTVMATNLQAAAPRWARRRNEHRGRRRRQSGQCGDRRRRKSRHPGPRDAGHRRRRRQQRQPAGGRQQHHRRQAGRRWATFLPTARARSISPAAHCSPAAMSRPRARASPPTTPRSAARTSP